MLNFNLRPDAIQPLYRQLVDQIRQQILNGTLAASDRLPPTRAVAQQLGVSRVTVKSAYEQLIMEGFLESRQGSGTFVVPLDIINDVSLDALPKLSDWAIRAVNIEMHQAQSKKVEFDFGFGRSFRQLFPYHIWRKLLARYLSTDDLILSRYGSPAGFAPLRQALAEYLVRVRGVTCSAEQIIVVNGMQQAIDIVARLLLQAGDEVLVESPGYVEAYRLLQVYGAQLVGLPVDEYGVCVDAISAESRAKLLFVTPANQFPCGGTLPLQRRLALLAWAREQNALILEDDYDSELRYDGQRVGALQGIDTSGRVIYLGTFSKVLFPALRLAYIVLPPHLIKPFLAAKTLIDRGSPTLTQAAITDFLTEGHFDRHVRRLRQTYGERRKRLVDALERHLPHLQVSPTEAGLHLMVDLPASMDEADFVRRAAAAGVGVYGAAQYHMLEKPSPAILLSFSGIADEKIEVGIGRLAQLF